MLILSQPPIPPTPTGTNLTGKTIIITGANTGIGYETAKQFLALGTSHLILACRSLSRGEAAASTLRADPLIQKTNPTARVEVYELDLSSYASGQRFAARVNARLRELDILVNNGGTASLRYERSSDGGGDEEGKGMGKGKGMGHERMMQVNCYTHVLISLALFPLLQKTAVLRGAPTRITWLGSLTHVSQHTLTKRPIPSSSPPPTSSTSTSSSSSSSSSTSSYTSSTSTPILSHFDDKANFEGVSRYADSKLAVNALVRKLALLAPAQVVVNNLCPGFVRTSLDRNLPAFLRLLMTLFRKYVGREVAEGARTVVYAAVVAGDAETNGRFLMHNRVHEGAAFLNEPAGQEFIDKLWAETVEDVAAVDPSLRMYADA